MGKDVFTTMADLIRESTQNILEREFLASIEEIKKKTMAMLESEFQIARTRARTEALQASVIILQKATEAGVTVDLRMRSDKHFY